MIKSVGIYVNPLKIKGLQDIATDFIPYMLQTHVAN